MKNLLFFLVLFNASHLAFAQTPRPTSSERIHLDPIDKPFYHGVASGDPSPNSMMIWTRITPDSGDIGDVKIYWQISTDVNFTNVVNYGYGFADEVHDYTFKTDVCGLAPNTYYYYMFQAMGRNSNIGRTKTAPLGDNDSARFAIVSCASYEHGYFHAYKEISERNDCDAVIHLGDYIYEYNTGGFSAGLSDRIYEPSNEIISLEDYRTRHSHYKLDEDLRRLHQLQPFITVWDDHETANDSYRDGADNHTPGGEGDWQNRKRNGVEAYNEWMPLRKPDETDTIRIWRKLRYGNLLDLVMIDSRLYDRDLQDLGSTNDPAHKMLGTIQKNWLKDQFSDSATQYKILCNQVMFAPLEVFGVPVNADQWDGYNTDRQEIEDHIRLNNIENVVILTGDIHTSWANDVPGPGYNSSSGANSICVEFVETSVTSTNFSLPVSESIIRALNPHMKYVRLTDHGYMMFDVNKSRVQTDYIYTTPVETPSYTTFIDRSFIKNNRENFLRNTSTPLSGHLILAPNPSLLPDHSMAMKKVADSLYFTIDKNTSKNFCLIPNVNSCPGYSVEILDSSRYGTLIMDGSDSCGLYIPFHNYSGYDTAYFIICQLSPFYCDTVPLIIKVNGYYNRSYVLADIRQDSTYNRCISYDDLFENIASSGIIAPSNGVATLLNDTCLSYTPNLGFVGIDTILIYACDLSILSQCDTFVFIITVLPTYTTQYIYAFINPDSIYSSCVGFDELGPSYSSTDLFFNNLHSYTVVSNDTCLQYIPAVGFIGNDTVKIIACKSGTPIRCDTICYIINVDQANDINAITESLVVFGANPNPFDEEIIIQYYLYEKADVKLKLTDLNGKIILENSFQASAGLKYGKLKGQGIPSGSYILFLQCGSEIYKKKIVKL